MSASATSLHRIIISVGDVQKCANFYRDTFGFTELPTDTPDWIELETGGCRLAFHKAHGAKGRIDSSTGPDFDRPGFYCPLSGHGF